ncbi:MAG: DUF3047 domain-containing protein [Nitrospirota bacterium]
MFFDAIPIQWPGRAAARALLAMTIAAASLAAPQSAASETTGTLLEDFASFPQHWKIKDDNPRAADIYRVVSDESGSYLTASVGDKPGVRIFKYVPWDTRSYPVVTWKWRLKSFPPDKRRSVAFYVSIHRDSFGIPTIVKYLWSTQEPVGTIREGGFFGATEIVVQSGAAPDPDGWVTARVDAVADFERIYGEAPGPDGVGIGVTVGMGLEADIADVRAEPRAVN